MTNISHMLPCTFLAQEFLIAVQTVSFTYFLPNMLEEAINISALISKWWEVMFFLKVSAFRNLLAENARTCLFSSDQ